MWEGVVWGAERQNWMIERKCIRVRGGVGEELWQHGHAWLPTNSMYSRWRFHNDIVQYIMRR